MKNFTLLFVVGLLSKLALAVPTESWTVKKSVQTPESVYYDAGSGSIFISNVAGSPLEKDNVGWIQKLDANGKVVSEKWVKGLSAPKGMRSSKGTLWVADLDTLVGIDIKTGKISSKLVIDGAKFLNDVAVGPEGEVYVSDTLTSKIHVVRDGQATIFAEGPQFESPNGLLFLDGKLYVASWGFTSTPDFAAKTPGRLYSIDPKSKLITYVTKQPLGNLDGLESDGKGNFIVSDWVAGKVFRVTPDGKSEVILEGLNGSADLAYITATSTLIVPRMGDNAVTAYTN